MTSRVSPLSAGMCDMDDDATDSNEHEQTLESRADLKEILEVGQDLALFFDDLQNSQQSR